MYMHASHDTSSPSRWIHLIRSAGGALLVLVWLYMVAWGVFTAISAFRPDAGGWEIGEWLITGALLLPIILIPLYLKRCLREKQAPGLKRWLPWVVRVMCLSIVLAMLDSWIAGTERRAPLFSITTWAMSDGGTRGYLGFGYSLTYYRRMGGVYGPEVWFWFTPFTISFTTGHVGVGWLWQQ